MLLSAEFLAALIAFAFVGSVTPGPNNMMLLASGVNFGFRRTIPHILGSSSGLMLMIAFVGLGLGQILDRYPAVHAALKIVGASYLLWLAWRLAHAGAIAAGEVAPRGHPMSFVAATVFQWVNPKAWVLAVAAVATYAKLDAFTSSVVAIALVTGAVNLPSVGAWALFGASLKRFLAEPRTLRAFNIGMALLLAASLWPLAADLGSR